MGLIYKIGIGISSSILSNVQRFIFYVFDHLNRDISIFIFIIIDRIIISFLYLETPFDTKFEVFFEEMGSIVILNGIT